MATYETSEFKKGLRIMVDGNPFIIVDNQFVKPGKGQAFSRVKIKNLLHGNVLDRTYKSGEKVTSADVLDVKMQFLYNDGDIYHFMDNKSYEQFEMNKENLGNSWKWLQEETEVEVVLYEGTPVSVTPPNFVVLEITYCEPGIKGDTATNASKPAELSSGSSINVPLFVNQGEFIRIDTRTESYVERVKQ